MSEIARLRRQIERECEAIKRAMEDFRITAPHDIIQQQYNALGAIQEQLTGIVGEHEAVMMVVEVYIHTIG